MALLITVIFLLLVLLTTLTLRMVSLYKKCKRLSHILEKTQEMRYSWEKDANCQYIYKGIYKCKIEDLMGEEDALAFFEEANAKVERIKKQRPDLVL